MNRLTIPIVLFATSAIAGCGSLMRDADIVGAQGEMAEPAACCDSLAHIPFRPSGLGEDVEVVLNRTSPAFSFAEGKSFVSGIALPVVPAAAFSLTFRTFISSGYLPGATVLVPKIACLDSTFSLISIQIPERLLRGQEFVAGTYFEGSVQLAPRTRYVVVLSDNIEGKPVTAVSSNGTPHSIPRAPVGKLKVLIRYASTGQTTRIKGAGGDGA